MIKIVLLGKTLYFIEKDDPKTAEKKFRVFTVTWAKQIQSLVEIIENLPLDENEIFYIVSKNKQESLKIFKSLFKQIDAAGGAVIHKTDKKLLMIFRNGKWDLPKGKIEPDEDIEEAAIREIEEECGVHGLTITKELPATYHTYILKGKRIMKKTFWFQMSYAGTEKAVPQISEGITKVQWLNREETENALKNSYEAIRDIVPKIQR